MHRSESLDRTPTSRETERRPGPASADRLKRLILFASIALFALSLVLPTISSSPRLPADRGYLMLAVGYVGVLIGQMGWFANPLWVAGLVYLHRKRWKAASIAGALSVLVAADSFVLYHKGIPSDSGRAYPFSGLLAGFYVWWASMWILAAGALLLWRGERRAEAPAES